ncbi:hypothetical protein B0H11DRAFT_2234011 [Mycena galericulata]|nr:hypothetical protein B0H11DRAFT_2234011 [Mycena galericulata]
MSTGGKPPRPQTKLIDDEAEEASQDDDDEDEDEYESSFIDDVDIDKETPTPAPREATGRTASTHSQDEVVSSTSSRNKAHRETTPLITRSQAKKIASTATLSDNGKPPSNKRQLNTLGHSLSGSSKAKGIQSSAIEKPPGDPGSQTQLATRPSGFESMPAFTPDLYDEFSKFLKYRAAQSEQNEMLSTPDSKRVAFKASDQAKDPMEVAEEEAEGSPQPRRAGRRVHTSGAAIRKTEPKVTEEDDPDTAATQDTGKSKTLPSVKGKQKDSDPVTNAAATSTKKVPAKSGKNKGKEKATEESPQTGPGPQSGHKRTRSTNSDDDTALPDNIAAAFMANAKSPSPSKKAKSAKAAGSSKTSTVLHTENIKTVSKLPARCAVTDKTLQDPLLHKIYRNLPPLSKGVFVSWSSGTGPGNFLFGQWPQVCRDIDARKLWACINFSRRLQYINPSRYSPVGIQAISQVYRDGNRWAMCVDSKTATCVSVGMAIHSALMEPSTVTTATAKSLWSKFLTVILHSQDFERLVGFVCMAFHVKSLHAQLHCDAISFGTRSFSKNSKPTASAKFSRGIPSSATKTASSTTFSSDDALSWEDEVPIYDGRHTAFNLSDDVDDLDNILPRFESNESEIPNSSCVAVAYTVSHYSSSSKDSVYFNIRFVVVIATPDEEGEEEEESSQRDGDHSRKCKAEMEGTDEDEA